MDINHSSSAVVKQSKVWIFALVVTCCGIFGFDVLYSTNTISDLSVLAGRYLVHALLLWFVFYVLFLRRENAKTRGISFIAIYITLLAGGLLVASKKQNEVTQTVTSIQQELARTVAASTDSNGYPVRMERTPLDTPKTKGELGELERFLKELIDRQVALRNDYLLDIDAIGWSAIFDAKRIKNDVMLTESNMMVEKAKTIVDKYESKSRDVINGARANINALNVSNSTKQEFLVGFEKGIGESRKNMDEQWKLERQVLLQFENVFLFLTKQKNWAVEGDQILFSNKDDLAKFNSYVVTIQRLTQQQQQIQKNSLIQKNQSLNSLKTVTKN